VTGDYLKIQNEEYGRGIMEAEGTQKNGET
jgi:hypothetical protein